MSHHEKYYTHAEAYDIAFNFKDVPKECDFLSGVCEKYTGKMPSSFLELAAGPALHSRELATRGVSTCALDCSPEMVAYATEQAQKQGIDIDSLFDYVQGDMVSFDLGRTFDLCAILMDSTSYLLTNDSVITHLNCVADHLNPGGLYVLEMGHPKYVFDPKAMGDNHWEMKRGDVVVDTNWGREDDEFDPITQITNTTVEIKVTRGEESYSFVEKAEQRCFTATEFDALVRCTGRFEIAAKFGAMDDAVPFDNQKKAWRMVSVLRKV